MTKSTARIILLATALLAGISLLIWKISSGGDTGTAQQTPVSVPELDTVPSGEPPLAAITIPRDIPVEGYFRYMDSLVTRYDSITPYPLSEYLIVRANPRILDSLENTDYYRCMERGNFVLDQRKMIILRAGDTLYLPGVKYAAALLEKMNNTSLDINIPAFELRIKEGDSTLYTFPVRVGKNKRKFLVMAGGTVDLRTHTGEGSIVRVNRNPVFYDPVTGKQFKFTKRDDGKTTLMPQIPWIEPEINGHRYGQMIHPTTNPSTLGKPASNGCIGTREGDAWRIYYYAPLGTRVVIRYDLTAISAQGDTLRYRDVYDFGKSGKQAALSLPPLLPSGKCWCLP